MRIDVAKVALLVKREYHCGEKIAKLIIFELKLAIG